MHFAMENTQLLFNSQFFVYELGSHKDKNVIWIKFFPVVILKIEFSVIAKIFSPQKILSIHFKFRNLVANNFKILFKFYM